MRIAGSDDTIPLIVAGPQRCGTRFVTGVLNAHPYVHVEGEIQRLLVEKALALLAFTTEYYNRRSEKEYEYWLEKRPELMACLWRFLGKDKIKDVSGAVQYFGYKTPFHERYFHQYQEYFNGRRVVCVYCIRNFRDHYLSVKARWPDRNIKQTAKRYLESLEVFFRIQRDMPDQVFPFVLELSGLYGVHYIEKALIEPLGLEMVPEFAAGVNPHRKANSTEKLGKIRPTLTNREAKYIEKHPRLDDQYRAIREKHVQMMIDD